MAALGPLFRAGSEWEKLFGEETGGRGANSGLKISSHDFGPLCVQGGGEGGEGSITVTPHRRRPLQEMKSYYLAHWLQSLRIRSVLL